jgi:hypothetical protein
MAAKKIRFSDKKCPAARPGANPGFARFLIIPNEAKQQTRIFQLWRVFNGKTGSKNKNKPVKRLKAL